MRWIRTKAPAVMWVWLAALAAFAVKVWIAVTTRGVGDTHVFWPLWATVVRQHGVYGIYALPRPGGQLTAIPYNHPPLTGWLLEGAAWLHLHGIPWGVIFRVPFDIADVAAALIVFYWLRERGSQRRAVLGAAITGASPILFVISGYHGNTDPLCATLVLLSAFLLGFKRRFFWAGVVLAMAVSVKLPAAVAVLPLLVTAARAGRRPLALFTVGALAVALPLWLPVLPNWRGFDQHVLMYNGSFEHDWGLLWLLHRIPGADPLAGFISGSGHFLMLLIAAACGVLVAWRAPTPQQSVVAGPLSMAAFLALTPAFGTQYMAWAASGAVLLDVPLGALFQLLGGTALVLLYARWKGDLPWAHSRASALTPQEHAEFFVSWLALVALVCRGIFVNRRTSAETGTDDNGMLTPPSETARIPSPERSGS